MIHIVFSKEDAENLKAAFDLEEQLRGDLVVVADDWSVGPLTETNEADEAAVSRTAWLSAHLNGSANDEVDTRTHIKERLNSDAQEQAWIWIAPNARDVSGYYHLISGLADFHDRIYTLWLNNLPFINEKGGIFYPDFLHEIPPREFVKARRLANPVTPATFETHADEWKKIQQENCKLRILEGAAKLSGKDERYFDKEIKNFVPNDWQKASRLVQQILQKTKDIRNRSFLLWRLRELIQSEAIEARGDWPGSENFDVRKMAQNPDHHE